MLKSRFNRLPGHVRTVFRDIVDPMQEGEETAAFRNLT
jgi:hypothetical protein